MQHQGTAFFQVRSWSHLSQPKSEPRNRWCPWLRVHAMKRFQRLETTIDSTLHTFTYICICITCVCVSDVETCILYVYIYIHTCVLIYTLYVWHSDSFIWPIKYLCVVVHKCVKYIYIQMGANML